MPSKKEERLQKKLDKIAKNKEKSARLSSSIVLKDKYIRSNITPELSKTPRAVSPENYKDCYLTWCNSSSDTNGSWSWTEPRQWSDEEYNETIKPHMDGCSCNSWNDIEKQTYNGRKKFRKSSNKSQPLSSVCTEAQQRWLSLNGLSDFEELFRFRLGSKKRIWGVRIDHHFFLIWYEREHLICPPQISSKNVN